MRLLFFCVLQWSCCLLQLMLAGGDYITIFFGEIIWNSYFFSFQCQESIHWLSLSSSLNIFNLCAQIPVEWFMEAARTSNFVESHSNCGTSCGKCSCPFMIVFLGLNFTPNHSSNCTHAPDMVWIHYGVRVASSPVYAFTIFTLAGFAVGI